MLKIISLGNILRGDDGIGPTVLEILRKINHGEDFELIDAGADAFILLEHLTQQDPVLLIDCARMGKNPGEFTAFTVEEANIEAVSSAIAIHGFSFAEIYKMAVSLGDVAPCTIIGVEPKTIGFNEPLSEEVKKNIPQIIKYIIGEGRNHAA